MKNKLYYFFVALSLISCQKDENDVFTSNAKEALEQLDLHSFIEISPDSESIIELYTEFLITTDTTHVEYIQAEDNGGRTTWNLEVKAKVMSVEIFNENASIPVSISCDLHTIKVKPQNIFGINSTFSLIVHYIYDAPKAKYIHGVEREKEFVFNTTSSTELNQSIIYCEYPLERQYNFLQGEYNFGFIKTNVKPDFLLSEQLKVRITNIHTNSIVEKQLVYDDNLGSLKYEMPVLINNQIYKIDYLRENNTELYRSNFFKTSIFNTFREKISTNFEGEHSGVSWWIEPCVLSSTVMGIEAEQGEALDFYEQVLSPEIGSDLDYENFNYPKLLTVEIDTVKTDMNRYGYGIARQLDFSVNRSTGYLGFIPIRDFFYLFNNENNTPHTDILLTDKEINNKAITQREISSFTIKSYVSKTIMNDIFAFQNQAINSNADTQLIDSLLDINKCGSDRYGKYYYTMKYIIPGINKECFTGNYEIGPTN